MKYNLSKEKRLVLLCSRISIEEKDIQKLFKLVSSELDWFKILKYCSRNKVVGLVWNNLKKLNLLDYIPQNINYLLKFFYEATKRRNEVLLNKQEELMSILKKENVRFARLKGGYLLKNIYVDLGTRFMNDLDFLIDKSQMHTIQNIMYELNYKNGRASINSGQIFEMDRKESIIWKTKMNNLPPFFQEANSDWCSLIDVDFSLYMDFNMDYDVTRKMLDKVENIDLQKDDFFIHICSHLYKEATNASWILLDSDINLIKFCDVRELLLKMSYDELTKIIEKAVLYNLQNALYYTLYYIQFIYPDLDIIKKIDIFNKLDPEILNKYGLREFGEAQTWEKDIIYRIFNGSKNEIKSKNLFYNLVN